MYVNRNNTQRVPKNVVYKNNDQQGSYTSAVNEGQQEDRLLGVPVDEA
jgi:hypothetical protein